MKKLFCCLLALLMILSASAALGENLKQIWTNCGMFSMNAPDGYKSVQNSAGYSIDGQTIGEFAAWFHDYTGTAKGGTCEELIEAWADNYGPSVPLINRLSSHISKVDAKLLESELYKWTKGEYEIIDEYYLMWISADFPGEHKEYEVIVSLSSETDGGGGMDYYVLVENDAYPEETDKSMFDTYIGEMKVVNCNEWVSLRFGPSANSGRLAKVPLGAVVEEAIHIDGNDFIYCCYNGQYGYILRDYLR